MSPHLRTFFQRFIRVFVGVIIPILLGLLSVLIALTSTAHSQEVVTKENVKRLLPHAYHDLIKNSEALPRNTVVFHWVDHRAILNHEPHGARDPQILDYLKKYTLRHWDKTINEGYGIYFAADPITSEAFGDDLVVVTLKKGTRFFKRNDYTALTPEAVEELGAYGCTNNGTVTGFSRIHNDNCDLKVLSLLLSAANIKFYTYKYVIFHKLPRSCNFTDNSALVVFDPSAFATEKTAIFDARYKIDHSFMKMAQRIQDWPGSYTYSGAIGLMNGITPISRDERNRWAKESLFECVDAK